MVDAQTLVDAVGLGAVYALMAVGIGLVFGVLRLVNFAYGQLIMAGAYTLAFTSGWPVAGSVARLLRRRDRALARDGTRGLPAAADAVAGGDARDDVRDRVPAPGRRADPRHPRRHDRRAGRLRRLPEPGRDRRRRRRPQGDDPRVAVAIGALGLLALLLGRRRSACRCGRPRPTSGRHACSASRPTA